MLETNNLHYEFGPYQFSPNERVLTREDEIISLTPKATELLIMLVTRAGQVVEKDELLREIWPDTFVEEANLSQNVFMLRRALGDERSGPKYIETVTRRGYRFIAPVKAISVVDTHLLTPPSRANNPQPPVIVVLPFVDTAGDSESEANQITASLINNLSRVSRLRVMSRSTVFRYKTSEIDPQEIAKELGASSVVVGKIHSQPTNPVVEVEFIDSSNGWQLWGETFDYDRNNLLHIGESITRNLLNAIRLDLSTEEEKRVTTRYTQNVDAYEAYLVGRRHWSRYTRTGLQEAIQHFQNAIKVDPNYALAYAAAIDCYLRLVTNYLPPDRPHQSIFLPEVHPTREGELDTRVKLRFEWDWKAAERELRRANDLRIDFPAAYQWYAAYRLTFDLFQNTCHRGAVTSDALAKFQPTQLHSETLSPDEEVQILCIIAREQVEVGNYEAGRLILKKYWTPGDWPMLDGLNLQLAADLLFSTGFLGGCLASTGRIPKGQKHAEALLSGSIGIFEQLGAKRAAAEAKIELALSYYRQGMFEAARSLLVKLLDNLQPGDTDLRSLALVRLAVVERHAGHITDSLSRLSVASSAIDQIGPFVAGRYYHELAAGLKDAAITNNRSDYLEPVGHNFSRAYHEFDAVGHLRYTAVVENNHGYLLLDVGQYDEAEIRFQHAHELFGQLEDNLRQAQVDDCLTRLYMATNRFGIAEKTIDRAISFLETDDEEAVLAEALTTKGLLFFKLNRHVEAKGILEGACRIAERCGDNEGAGRALLILVEEMHNQLEPKERNLMALRIKKLLEDTQQTSTRNRLVECLKKYY